MAIFYFESMTAANGTAFTAGTDSLVFDSASTAQKVAVSYVAAVGASPARIDVTYNGKTVAFTPQAADISQVTLGDGSVLSIGGTTGNVFATSSALGDALLGGGGDDSLSAGAGANYVHGNLGNDSLVAGTGSDTLLGGQGNDIVQAGDGNNYVHGNLGNDDITSGTGNDTLLVARVTTPSPTVAVRTWCSAISAMTRWGPAPAPTRSRAATAMTALWPATVPIPSTAVSATTR